MSRFFFTALAGFAFFISGCASFKTGEAIKQVRFIGAYELPKNYLVDGTLVGGLSGIDYDSSRGVYYLICDDRSDRSPARFYTAKIFLSATGIDSVAMISQTPLRMADGGFFPNKNQDPFNVPDPEALRYYPATKQVFWTSEGERLLKNDTMILNDPSVYVVNLDGEWVDSFSTPANLRMQPGQNGPRQNGTFEGLAFTPDHQSLFVSVEEPIYNDGPRAGLGDSTAWVRFVKFDVNSRQPLAQYAYQIDPVVLPAQPAGAFKVNGVTDILAVNNETMIVTERSYSTGNTGSNIRVYMADMKKAEPVAATQNLLQQPPLHPIRKKLLVNMENLGIFIDNIEGATFGPRLPNGKRSLIFVADDNFSPAEKNQFLLFEVN
ncbi:MAG: esterase-like activity of phytase family protein [Flavisolibacter sp.]